jgi:hypothetical protein
MAQLPNRAMWFSPSVAVFLILACFSLPAQNQSNGIHSWKTYTNVRFQYSTCYPQDLLVPQGEADNSDGQAFLAKDGAKLLVYGRNNDLKQTTKEVSEETASRLKGSSGKVTHQTIRPRSFVVSGVNKGNTFYEKTVYDRGQFKSFEITYDSSLSAVYGPVIQKLSACFTSTSP